MGFLRICEQSIRRARKRVLPQLQSTSCGITKRFVLLKNALRTVERKLRRLRKRLFCKDFEFDAELLDRAVQRPLSPRAQEILAQLTSPTKHDKAA